MTRTNRLERAQTRLGAYSLLRPLSESEVARDFLAHVDDGDGSAKYCVVRTVNTALSAHDHFAAAFEEAYGLAASIDDGNLVRVIDAGQQDGEYFLATEYSPGTRLSSLQDRLRNEGKQLPAPCVVAVGLALSSALHRLSTARPDAPILHGDVSLERVHVSSSGDLKLGDFCVERAVRALPPPTGATGVRERAKSPRTCAHLAVEQLLDDHVDVRADQYALGLLMYELLWGAPAFERHDLAATVAAVLGARRPDLRGLTHVPEDLAAIVDRALSRRPSERYPTPAALNADLQAVAARCDMTSAVGLLGGLARGLQPPIELEPQSEVIQLTEAMFEPLPESDLSGSPIVDLSGAEGEPSAPSWVDAYAAPASRSPSTARPSSSPTTPDSTPLPISNEDSNRDASAQLTPGTPPTEGIATMLWIALLTTVAIASLFLWAWALGR